MLKIENEKLKPCLVLSIIHLGLACAVLVNELMSISNRVPGGSFPIEHKYSWLRVSLFCGVAIIGAFVVWILNAKKPSNIFLPSLLSVLLLGMLLTVMSLLSGYESVTGWCCDVYPTRYFGLPFSFIMAGNPLAIFAKFDLARILKYNFLSYQFLLDLLFWSNVMFISLSLKSSFLPRRTLTQHGKEQGFSEIS
jgi:hypothetical protein